MKKRTALVLLAIFTTLVTSAVINGEVFAIPSSYQNCLESSGRWNELTQKMESIRWACNGKFNVNAGIGWCAMWLGPSNNSYITELPEIDYNSLSSSQRENYNQFYLYGMCISNNGSGTSLIAMTEPDVQETVGGKNGPVDDGRQYLREKAIPGFLWDGLNVWRPSWTDGTINGVPLPLNLDRFIDMTKDSRVDLGNNTYLYSKEVRLFRCSAIGSGWEKVCSSEKITLSIKVKETPPPELDPDNRCADWAPSQYLNSNVNRGYTDVVTKVRNHFIEQKRNNADSNYGWAWYDTVYAKPGDKIEWIHCYYPGVQMTADTQVRHSSGQWASFSNSIFGTWNNWSKVSFENVRVNDSIKNIYGNTGGDVVNRSKTIEKRDWYDIANSSAKVGQVLKEGQTTGIPVETNITNSGWNYTRNNDSRKSSATAIVPYNFINRASVSLKSSLTYVVAGGTAEVSFVRVSVGKKKNALIDNVEYATNVKDARVKLVAYASNTSGGSEVFGYSGATSELCNAFSHAGACNTLETVQKDLNESANPEGSSDVILSNKSYNVYDVQAGSYYCVRVAVYPYTSGADDNTSAAGDNKWYISAPSCVVVAKIPMFQVWGGSLYSAASINTESTAKNNLAGVSGYGYSTTGRDKTTIFSSWVEQSVAAVETVSELASGAATGKNALPSGNGSLEGTNVSFCNNRTPLSLANYQEENILPLMCPLVSVTGNLGSSLPTENDRGNIVQYWSNGYNVLSGENAYISSLSNSSYYRTIHSPTGKQVRYSGGANNISIGTYSGVSDVISNGVTHIIKANRDVNINRNVIYSTTGIDKVGQIPKVIIIAGRNININCSVTRIDAILVAGGTIDTCSDASGTSVDAQKRSKQLNIVGATISDKLVLGRTYGAATGVNSSEPAEVINYDTSVLIWGTEMSDADISTKNLSITYQRELPPRY